MLRMQPPIKNGKSLVTTYSMGILYIDRKQVAQYRDILRACSVDCRKSSVRTMRTEY